VVNPPPQRLVFPYCASNRQSEISCVRVYKAWADPAIPSMAVNQCQSSCAHFPSLLHNLVQHSIKNDLGGVVSMKIDFHDELALRFLVGRSCLRHLPDLPCVHDHGVQSVLPRLHPRPVLHPRSAPYPCLCSKRTVDCCSRTGLHARLYSESVQITCVLVFVRLVTIRNSFLFVSRTI